MLGQTIISFETKPLEACVTLTRTMDKLCFPEEMWLGAAEFECLLQHHAESTILTLDGIEIGQAITLPECAAAHLLDGVDEEFCARPHGVYSYSEAILPAYQNLGYGALLLHEIALRMRQRGYTAISAHVRTRHGWNKKRTQTLAVTDTRLLHNFWEDPREVVQYQNAHL